MNTLISEPWAINLRERMKTIRVGITGILGTYLLKVLTDPSFNITTAFTHWHELLGGGVVVALTYFLTTLIGGKIPDVPPVDVVTPVVEAPVAPIIPIVAPVPVVEVAPTVVAAPVIAAPTVPL